MTKRLFACVLVFALILSFVPAISQAVTAEGKLEEHTSHEGWINWGDDEAEWTTLPSSAGQYYLTHDVTLNGSHNLGANIHLCLNDHTITQTKSGARHFTLTEGKGITLSVYDCGTKGKLTGGTAANGASVNVSRTNTFNLYGGIIAGNNSTGDAVIYIQAANATRPTGGVFNMYGGEISGNKATNGIVYGAGGAAAYTNSQVNIYGGTIKGNTVSGSGGAIYGKTYGTIHVENAEITGNKGTNASAIYVQNNVQLTIKDSTITGNQGTASSAEGYCAAVYLTGATAKVTLSGNVTISGNTMKNTAIADLFINSSAGYDIETLYINELTGGNVRFGVKDKADSVTEASQVVALNGTQNSWQDGWLTYVDGAGEAKNVAYSANAGFFFGQTPGQEEPSDQHSHKLSTGHGDAVTFQPWESTTSLPTSGNYFLTENVSVSAVTEVDDDLNLCLNGKTVTQTTANRIFIVKENKKLNITDCSSDPGALTGGRNNNGSAVYVRDGAVFSLYGGRITNCAPVAASEQSGAPVYLRSATTAGATFNMYGGEITGNGGAKCWGGAVTNGGGHAANTVYVNIYGGKIYGNTALTGGAIRMKNAAVVTVSGGEIYDNTAKGSGGAIYLDGTAKLDLQGGNIHDNTAATSGAGIYMPTASTVTVSGGPVVMNNMIGEKLHNLYVGGNAAFTVGQMKAGAQIGLSRAESRNSDVISKNTVDPAALDYFAADNSDKYEVDLEQGYLALVEIDLDASHSHKPCKDASCTDHDTVLYKKWRKTDSLPTSGSYYLTGDVKLSAAASVSGDLNLCLNGFTVTAAEGKRVFTIAKGNTLNLTDCSAEPGALTGGTQTWGAAVNINVGATFNLFGGKITGNRNVATSGGIGAIYVQGAGSVFNMYGGEISGNEGVVGTIHTPSGITGTPMQINLYGGIICGNKCVKATTASGGTTGGNGGAVYVSANTLVTIDGGEICHNEAAGNGGGLFVNGKDAVVTMNSGKISGNKAVNGAGMILQTRSKFVFNGGQISENQATSGGGGIYASNTTEFEMKGGMFSGNRANNGAGFFCLRNTVTIDGGQVVGNEAANRAGGMVFQGATAEIRNLTVSENSSKEGTAAYIYRASYESGGETVYVPAKVDIYEGVLITKNRSQTDCGGILLANDDVVVTMHGGEISGNGGNNGAGVMIWKGATFIMKGGKITKHTVKSYGAGVYVSTGGAFKMEGGSISNNTAKGGAGIYLNRSAAVLSGGTVSGNTAKYEITWADGKEQKSGGNSGAIHLYGAELTLSGVNVTGNVAEGNGGAISTGRYTDSATGTYKDSKITMTAGSLSGNKATHGGAIITQTGAVFNFHGGTIANNEASVAGAGIYVSTKSALNMTGGRVVNNSAKSNGAGIYCLRSTVNITGGEIGNNKAVANSANLMVNGSTCVVNVKNVKIYGGEAKTGAAIVIQSKGTLNMENCQIYGNKTVSGHGGAVYVSNKSHGNFTGCKFFDNQSASYGGAVLVNNFAYANFKDCEFYENTAAKQGGAVWCSVASKSTMEDCTLTKNTAQYRGGAITCKGDLAMTNCVVAGNTAGTDGGGIHTDINTTSGSGKMEGLILKNCRIEDNVAANQGGGLFIHKGCKVTVYDSRITGNTAGLEGGAMWVFEDLELHGATITGNTSGGEGYAVYMYDANYDGHSYYNSHNKLSGNVIIRDNQGGDLWMGPDVLFAITADGLGQDTHIELAMDSGVVTNRIFGAFHYEGGDQVYTITYGDRSVTDPEYDATLVKSEQIRQEPQTSNDTLLFVSIGVVALAAVAVMVLVLLKKKKETVKE